MPNVMTNLLKEIVQLGFTKHFVSHVINVLRSHHWFQDLAYAGGIGDLFLNWEPLSVQYM